MTHVICLGVVKVVATAIFIFFGVETLGRKGSLFVSAMGMGTLFFIIGAILKTHPPDPKAINPPPASRAMAGMLYIYVCFYSMGWGQCLCFFLALVMLLTQSQDLSRGCMCLISFPQGRDTTGSRSPALRSGCSVRLFQFMRYDAFNAQVAFVDFVVSKVTPDMITDLGYKIFLMFATVNIGAMGLFSA